MSARTQALAAQRGRTWSLGSWRMVAFAVLLAVAIAVAILSLTAGGSTTTPRSGPSGTVPVTNLPPGTGVAPAGGYELPGGVVCNQCR